MSTEMYYGKNLGEKNFKALNDALKHQIEMNSELRDMIGELRLQNGQQEVKLQQLEHKINVFFATTFNGGSTA